MRYVNILPLMLVMTAYMAMGQEYSVVSFEPALKDLTARTANTSRVDGNGRKCAVIKVYVDDGISAVRGNAVGDVPATGMEKWIYLSHDSKDMEIVFENHYPLHITFMDYDIPTVTGQMTYILKLKEIDRNSYYITKLDEDSDKSHNIDNENRNKQDNTILIYSETDEVSNSISQTPQQVEVNLSIRNKTSRINELANIEKIFGCRFKSLDPEDMKNLKGDEGLQISEIVSGPFKEAKVKNSFIILTLNNQKVRTTDDLISIWTSLQEKSQNVERILILGGVYPNGRKGYYAVSIPKLTKAN